MTSNPIPITPNTANNRIRIDIMTTFGALTTINTKKKNVQKKDRQNTTKYKFEYKKPNRRI